MIPKLNLLNRLLIYKLLMSIKIEIRELSPRCLYPRKESFVYFSESLRESTIALRVEISSLCAASRMWVRHRSVVIVPPEGDLEFRWDSETCWYFIHVTIKLDPGTTQRSVIESCITRFLLPTRNSSGRAASRGALAPQPPRAHWIGPEQGRTV